MDRKRRIGRTLGEKMTHVWVGKRYLPERYGQECRIMIAHRGKFVLLFDDGHLVSTVRGTFRRLSWLNDSTPEEK